MKWKIGLVLGLYLGASTGWTANKAGVVIQNSTGEVITRCVEFEEEFVTVEDLLAQSGFAMITEDTAWGAQLHYLHDDGVPFGVTHSQGWFWNFFLREDDQWISAPVGISSATAVDGSLFGFGFGAWGEVELPQRTYADVCEVTNQAALVIDHSNGARIVQVVEFYGETITGLQLLLKSNLDVVSKETFYGTAVCAIDGEGQPADDCFGDAEGRYWGLNILDSNNAWAVSIEGAGDLIVRRHDVHGYIFGLWGVIQPPIDRSDIFEIPSGIPFWGSYWN
ncbi:MAG: hypothetical protein JXR73_09345 [Candidatus Omnitrophica bacterium]|nr:hypothetical protein [Candidatus Omnitrophota bacterium]